MIENISDIEQPKRCRAGDQVMFIAGPLAGRTGIILCRPMDDIKEDMTAEEISLALINDWVVQVNEPKRLASAYGRQFWTNMYLALDRQLVPLSSDGTMVESEEEVSV